MLRSPQGHALLVQVGSSESGKDFAARWAEALFTAQPTPAEGQAFYADVKRRAAGFGRDPELLKVLPIEEWFRHGAADGFNIMPAGGDLPTGTVTAIASCRRSSSKRVCGRAE